MKKHLECRLAYIIRTSNWLGRCWWGVFGAGGQGKSSLQLPKESSLDRLNYSHRIFKKKKKGKGLKSCKWRRNAAARRGREEEGRWWKDPPPAGRRSWQSCELEELKCKADNSEQAEMKTEHDAFQDVEEGRLWAGVGLKSLLICRDDFDVESFNWRGHESSSQPNIFHPLLDVVT